MAFESQGIRLARRDEARDALELLLAECAPADRPALIEGMAATLPETDGAVGGLFVAWDGQVLSGVGLGQVHAGRTGSVWRPRFADSAPNELGAALTHLPAEWLTGCGLRLLQSLVTPADAAAARWLRQSGFSQLARLAYLVWTGTEVVGNASGLRFTVPSAEQLADVMERSYVATLDCPALNGVRTHAEVLEGYREIGEYWPEAWLLAWRGEQPVGCLILADHPIANQCELVYMGLVPEARGKRLGRALVRQAQELIGKRRRARLVLAVDLDNRPAIQLYEKQGFQPWDERDVFVRILDRAD